jgi:hypothetical protein
MQYDMGLHKATQFNVMVEEVQCLCVAGLLEPELQRVQRAGVEREHVTVAVEEHSTCATRPLAPRGHG